MRSHIFRHFYSEIITLNVFLTSTVVYMIFLRVDTFFYTVFICEFSHLDQFYSFTRVIHSCRFLPQYLSDTRAIF